MSVWWVYIIFCCIAYFSNALFFFLTWTDHLPFNVAPGDFDGLCLGSAKGSTGWA